MAGDFDFGLGAVTEAFNTQSTLRTNRQTEENQQLLRKNAAAADLAQITKKSSDVSANLLKDLNPLMGVIDEVQKGAEEQTALRASGDPFDLISSIGNEILDPAKYTRAGRAKTLSETQQIIGAKTQAASLQQAAMQDLSKVVEADLAASAGGLNIATLLETQGAERIQAEVTRVQTQAQTLASNNALIQSKIAMMSSDEVKAAAAKSGGKPIDIGGVMVSPGALEERVFTLDQRDELREARQNAIETKKTALADKLAMRELSTHSAQELGTMLLNGTDQFPLDKVKQVYDIKMTAQADALTRNVQSFQLRDFGATTIVPAADEIDSYTKVIPKGTASFNALEQYRRNLGGIANVAEQYQQAGKAIPIETKAASDAVIKASKEELYKAVEKEAIQAGKGDKNLTDVYRDFYNGRPISSDSIQQVVGTRLEKNQPMTDVFPPETSKLIQEQYNIRKQKLEKDNSMASQMGGGLSKEDIKRQAMTEAVQEGVKYSIKERTTDMFRRQVEMPGHPLAGILQGNHATEHERGMTDSSQVLGVIARSDNAGRLEFQKRMNLSDEEMQTFLGGGSIEGKVGPGDRPLLNEMQNQQMLITLDGYQPGLGQKYVDWWQKNAASFIETTKNRRLQEANQKGVQGAALETVAGPMESQQIGQFVVDLTQAADGYGHVRAERYNNMVSFDYKPENRQAALLQFDSSLNDGERTTLMKKLILPIVNAGKEKGLGFEEINKAIESAIDSNVAPDAETAAALKKLAKNRANHVQNLESILTKPFWRSRTDDATRKTIEGDSFWSSDNTQQFNWYKQALGEK